MCRIREMPTWADSKAVLPSAQTCISTGLALFCWMNLFLNFDYEVLHRDTPSSVGMPRSASSYSVQTPDMEDVKESVRQVIKRTSLVNNSDLYITCREWASLEGDYQEWPVGSWVQFRCIFIILSAWNDVPVNIWDMIVKEQQTKSAIFLSESQTGQLVVRFRYLVDVC